MVDGIGIEKCTRDASYIGVEGCSRYGIVICSLRRETCDARAACSAGCNLGVRPASPQIALGSEGRRQHNVAVICLQSIMYRPGANIRNQDRGVWRKGLLNAQI